MNKILNDSSKIIGHIYIITNLNTKKQYVGQTLSHRKNKNKYRPFGFQGRFKDHISEALCNTKKKQCNYLNNSIREYGKDAFKVELIIECPKEELDTMEEKYIKEFNTLYPNGYNLTTGGKMFKNIDTNILQTIPTNVPKKRGGCTNRSSETRAKMTESLKIIFSTQEARQEQMLRSQEQHNSTKINIFKGVNIDIDNIEQYIKIINKKDGSKFIKVIVENKVTSFVGKYQTIDQLKLRAIEFLKSVKNFATLPN
jgi:hypothetical protein